MIGTYHLLPKKKEHSYTYTVLEPKGKFQVLSKGGMPVQQMKFEKNISVMLYK